MKYAWIENNVVRDVAHGNPSEMYHPDIAKLYDTEVPDDASNGDAFENGVLTKPQVVVQAPVENVVEAVPPVVSAIEYKMLFTVQERVAIRISQDPIVQDVLELLNDPRVTTVDLALKSNQDVLDYLTSIGLLADGRKAEILTGKVL